MKKLIFAAVLSILSLAGFATDRNEKNDDAKSVSANTKKEFQAEFKNAEKVSWTLTNEYQKAKFTLDGKNFTAIFDLQGNYLGATQYITYSELPEKAQKEIAKHYKGYDFSEALKVAGRPLGDFTNNDVGVYWIDMVKEGKEIYLNYSESAGVVFYKSVEASATAKN